MSSYYTSEYPPLDAEQTEDADQEQQEHKYRPHITDDGEEHHYASMGGADGEQVSYGVEDSDQHPVDMSMPTGREEYGEEQTPAYGEEETPAYGEEETPAYGEEETPAYGEEEAPAYGETQQLSYADAVGNDDGEETGEYKSSTYGAEEEVPEEEQAYAAQQSYGDADIDGALEAAGDDICAAAAQLWALDTNRLTPGTDYTVSTERAPERYGADGEEEECELGPYVTEIQSSVWERETYSLLKALLDNYSAETGVPERVSSEERAEEAAFISAVCATPVMQFAQRWLAANASDDETRESCADESAFGELVHDLWFGLYGRDGRRDSSGFEHVFCGEIDDGRVKGLHNFVQVVVEEERGNLQFGGCVGREDGDPDAQVSTIRFKWMGLDKRASSMFVGVSPEFETALYTMWWLGGGGGDEVELGAHTVRVKMHELRGKLGAAYPEVLDIDYDELDSSW